MFIACVGAQPAPMQVSILRLAWGDRAKGA